MKLPWNSLVATKQHHVHHNGRHSQQWGLYFHFFRGGWWNDARAHNNFMIAKFTAQMRPRAQGSQRVTEEHNSFIGASINARTKEFLERSHWPTIVVFGSLLPEWLPRLWPKWGYMPRDLNGRQRNVHISFIGASINPRAKEFLERSHWLTVVAGSL